MGSFSRMPLPFAALTVLENDDKGLQEFSGLAMFMRKRNSGGERHSAGDGEMK